MSNNLNVLPVPPSELPNSSTNESANDSTDDFVDEVIHHTGYKLANLIFQDKFVKKYSNNSITSVGTTRNPSNPNNNAFRSKAFQSQRVSVSDSSVSYESVPMGRLKRPIGTNNHVNLNDLQETRTKNHVNLNDLRKPELNNHVNLNN
jgi:hypothetical protein